MAKLICPYCQQELRSRGEKLFIGCMKYSAEESVEYDIPCEWCDEYDELWETIIIGKGENDYEED